MTNKYLAREDAPIAAETWNMLDRTMQEAARGVLAGRRLLEIEGPYGLGLKAIPLSDTEESSGMISCPSLPLYFLRVGFSLSRRDLAAFERDGIFLDLAPVARAAIECAKMEDGLVFNGAASAAGLLTATGHAAFSLSQWEQPGAAEDIIKAVTLLDEAGYHGPYALALSPARYNLLSRIYPGGHISELEHVKTITTAGVVKAPALEGGVLLAAGRQFASIVLGQDMSISFTGMTAERLDFTVSESLTPFIRQPRAVCVLD